LASHGLTGRAGVRAGWAVGEGGGMTWDTPRSQSTVHGRGACVAGTHMGEIEDADGFGEHGSIACGDALRFTSAANGTHPTRSKDRIVEARYLTFRVHLGHRRLGALCVIIETGRFSPVQALGVRTRTSWTSSVGCRSQDPLLGDGCRALEGRGLQLGPEARGGPGDVGARHDPSEQEEGRLVCKCFGVTEPYLRRKIKELGLHSIPEITNAIKAGGACMSCHHAPGGLRTSSTTSGAASPPSFVALPSVPEGRREAAAAKPELSPYQFAKQVERVLSEDVRPRLQG